MAVTKVVNTDALHACGFRPSVHLVMKIAFRYRKDTVFFLQAIEHTEILDVYKRQILPTRYKRAKIVLNKIKPVSPIVKTKRYGVELANPLKIPASKVIPPEKARITAEKIVSVVIDEILLFSNFSSNPLSCRSACSAIF